MFSSPLLHLIVRYLFDPEQFKRWFEYYRKNNHSCLKILRCMVQIGTIDACLRGKYFLPDGTDVLLDKKDLEAAAKNTIMYTTAPPGIDAHN